MHVPNKKSLPGRTNILATVVLVFRDKRTESALSGQKGETHSRRGDSYVQDFL